MSKVRLKIYLFLTIMILSLLPLCASYFLLGDIIEGSLNVGVNSKVNHILNKSQEDLKKLKNFETSNSESYKKRFYEIENIKTIFKNPDYTKKILKNTYLSYFLAGFCMILFISIFTAFVLSRKIIESYNKITQSLLEKKLRLNQLKNIDEWQEIAGKLAHEIKNPLTPMELMISSLNNSYKTKSQEEFKNLLNDTQLIIKQEIKKLKDMVYHFSSFSKLPDSVLKSVDFIKFINDFIKNYSEMWPDADISVNSVYLENRSFVNIDEGLFIQVLINILNNSVQANPGNKIEILFSISIEDDSLLLSIINNGKIITEEERGRIFKMYYTSGKTKENMGLGLSIVQKIIFEHQGDVICLPLKRGAGFKITLPIDTDKNEK